MIAKRENNTCKKTRCWNKEEITQAIMEIAASNQQYKETVKQSNVINAYKVLGK